MSKEALSQEIVQLQEITQRLQINLRAVHSAKCCFYTTAWRQVRPVPD